MRGTWAQICSNGDRLNKHKDSHPLARLRKRAGAAIAKLNGLADRGNPAPLRQNVTALFETVDPQIDFAAHQLRVEIADDFLIGSAISLRNRSVGSRIWVVTADIGLKLKTQHHGLHWVFPPDDFKLPEEPDPNESKVKQLEEEIRNLRHRMPDLALRFQNDLIRFEANLSRATSAPGAPLKLAELIDDVEQIKLKYPKIRGTPRSNPMNQPALQRELLALSARQALSEIPQKEIDRYNAELDVFYEKMRSYSKSAAAFEDAQRRSVQLDLLLVNSGGAAASDISIFLHFPGGFTLFAAEDAPRPPALPNPPQQPRSQMDVLKVGLAQLPFDRFVPPIPRIGPPPNVSSFRIEKTSSYDVSVHVKRLKHGFEAKLDPLIVAFESWETVSPFTVTYEIHAEELPTPAAGQLHVICKAE